MTFTPWIVCPSSMCPHHQHNCLITLVLITLRVLSTVGMSGVLLTVVATKEQLSLSKQLAVKVAIACRSIALGSNSRLYIDTNLCGDNRSRLQHHFLVEILRWRWWLHERGYHLILRFDPIHERKLSVSFV